MRQALSGFFLFPVQAGNHRVFPCLVALVLAMATTGAGAADLFVDGANGKDSNAGVSARNAFQTPLHAWSVAKPGDTIHLLPSVVYGPLYLQGNAGTPGHPITLQGDGAPPNRTKISGKGQMHGLRLETGANYVTVRNLDIMAPGPYASIFVMKSHHIVVTHNVLHDSGAAGFSSFGADYLTVDRNIVYRNSRTTSATLFGSGISIGESMDVDQNTGVKMIIRNNAVYDNTNVAYPGCAVVCDTDGSGIIIDDNRRTQHDNIAYKGATLVENNVIFNNGGRGIHIYDSDHVTVRGNTLYHNNQDPNEWAWGAGEIMASRSGGVSVYNNIFFAPSGSAPGTGPHVGFSSVHGSGDPTVADYNLFYAASNDRSLQSYTSGNSNSVTIGSHNKWGNPLFRTLGTDPHLANFRVLPGSPATGFASPAGTWPATDILGIRRTLPITVGAYQAPYRTAPQRAPLARSAKGLRPTASARTVPAHGPVYH